MTIRTRPIRCLAILAAALAVAPLAAQAQSLKDLTGAVGAVTGGGGGLPSVEQASPSNLTGVLEYCVKNKYLGGGSAEAGSSLLGKLTGSGKASDEGAFKAGSGGMLETGGGDMLSLGGSGVQEKVTEQVCDLVLEHAQSLL
ncbi:MAG: DUF2501 domain-containing protein [Geminicoccaceae bacterium]